MPAKSKSQYRYMQGICHGSIKPGKDGPSKAQACEFVEGQSSKGLPEKKKKAFKQFQKNLLAALIVASPASAPWNKPKIEKAEIPPPPYDIKDILMHDQKLFSRYSKAMTPEEEAEVDKEVEMARKELLKRYKEQEGTIKKSSSIELVKLAISKNASMNEQKANEVLRSYEASKKYPETATKNPKLSEAKGIKNFTKELDKIETVFFDQDKQNENKLNPYEAKKTAAILVEMALKSKADYIRSKVRE